MGEHPGEKTLASSSGLVTEGLCWCSWGCLGSALFAALAFAMWHLISTRFGKGCRRAGTAPSMSPKLGKGPLDEEREGGGGMQVWREAENAAS